MTPSGIEPATFRFGAQHLNHCATAVPQNVIQWYSFLKTQKLNFGFLKGEDIFELHRISCNDNWSPED